MKAIDSEEDFLKSLEARAKQYADLVNAGKMPKSYACFELLTSIFSAFEGGIEGEKITTYYPVANWREDKVEIPRALLRPIIEGWMNYIDTASAKSLGEAFDLEGGGSGKRPTRALQRKIDRDHRLSNLVIVDYISSRIGGSPISQDAAFQAVADAEGVSYETVRKAYQKHSTETLIKLEREGVKIS